eukprot:TRINITY_DN17740_c0_g1_i1.p2 TRINITY_DN17740_c0_g1~~TRINITY_DN17740_c0_g1_i1.p2  ORF type:complete len:208 (-),score=73.47 TRINITY_DN17740_c0_g1_i1:128-751(-)
MVRLLRRVRERAEELPATHLLAAGAAACCAAHTLLRCCALAVPSWWLACFACALAGCFVAWALTVRTDPGDNEELESSTEPRQREKALAWLEAASDACQVLHEQLAAEVARLQHTKEERPAAATAVAATPTVVNGPSSAAVRYVARVAVAAATHRAAFVAMLSPLVCLLVGGCFTAALAFCAASLALYMYRTSAAVQKAKKQHQHAS